MQLKPLIKKGIYIILASTLLSSMAMAKPYLTLPIKSPKENPVAEDDWTLTGQSETLQALRDTAIPLGESWLMAKLAVKLGFRTSVILTLSSILATRTSDHFSFVLREYTDKEDQKTQAYFERLWGFYLRDPELVPRMRPLMNKAVQRVNESCLARKLPCRIDPSRVFISSTYEPKVDREKDLYFVTADAFIKREAQAVEDLALQLGELIGEQQLPREVDKIIDSHREDGSVGWKRWDDDTLGIIKARRWFATELIQPEMSISDSTLSPQEIIVKRFERYKPGAQARQLHDQESWKNVPESVEAQREFAKKLMSYRIQIMPISSKIEPVMTHCGLDGTEKLFANLTPCTTLPMSEIFHKAMVKRILAFQTKREFLNSSGNIAEKFSGEEVGLGTGLFLSLLVDTFVIEKLGIASQLGKISLRVVGGIGSAYLGTEGTQIMLRKTGLLKFKTRKSEKAFENLMDDTLAFYRYGASSPVNSEVLGRLSDSFNRAYLQDDVKAADFFKRLAQ